MWRYSVNNSRTISQKRRDAVYNKKTKRSCQYYRRAALSRVISRHNPHRVLSRCLHSRRSCLAVADREEGGISREIFWILDSSGAFHGAVLKLWGSFLRYLQQFVLERKGWKYYWLQIIISIRGGLWRHKSESSSFKRMGWRQNSHTEFIHNPEGQ